MKFHFLDRFSKEHAKPEATVAGPSSVQIDTSSLSHVFSAPTWVRDIGLLTWFLVGVGVLLVGLVVQLGIMSTILIPVTLGAIVATSLARSCRSSSARCRARPAPGSCSRAARPHRPHRASGLRWHRRAVGRDQVLAVGGRRQDRGLGERRSAAPRR